MSDAQHTWDIKNLPGKHFSEGGKGCLNRHQGYKESAPCSHQWQGYQKALSDPDVYNWPAYESLSVKVRKRSFFMETFWFISRTTRPPEKGEWDLSYEFKNRKKKTMKNFRTNASTPYWHEAHHIVPNSVLRGAILSVGRGHRLEGPIILMVRGGLMGEGYNLNGTLNMIILPMDKRVSLALGLPRHRKTRRTRSHKGYSKHVRKRLDDIFHPLKDKVDECKGRLPRYRKCRRQIEEVSEDLYSEIKGAGVKMKEKGRSQSIDDMPASSFVKKASKKADYGSL
ncbi:AHH domain-containing protein [Myxococcus sp. RHSTA-1-4]|uniref:AHH domain-containing protein n=1 Tax=Myxococcus sp. RHSTA-1-4 TaxID=2874601 RepID=UPI001CBF1D3C|nr:AHH domain-containing protein [Myxococcus sp. RHSTA-1-4]MBZ4415086.1 AHH domain-containing protein [Myxococcus sp. RHSTA-1-4]